MSENEVKDSVEFLAVNITGVGLSLGNIDSNLRTGILIATLIYAVFKIIKIYKDIKFGKNK